MVRALLLSLFFVSLLSADAVDRVRQLLSPEAFGSHQKLIALLFENDGAYCRGDTCDMAKIVTTLEENGLLDLSLPGRQEVVLTLSCAGEHPLFFIKSVEDALRAAGLTGLLTKGAALDEEGFRWSVAYTADSAPDPLTLVERFARMGIRVMQIERSDAAHWRYRLDIRHATVPARALKAGENLKIVRPVRPVWLEVAHVRSLTLRELPGSHWFPDVVVYDKMLHILSMKQNDTRTRYMHLNLPAGAVYVRINDRFTLENIRSGLRIGARGAR